MNGHLKVVQGAGGSLALSGFPRKSAALLSALAALAIVLSPGFCSPGRTSETEPAATARQSAETSSAGPAAAAPKILVAITGAQATIVAANQPLSNVLDEISRNARIAFAEDEAIGKSLVSIEIRDVPLDQALRALLKDFDVFFYYHAPANGGTAALEAVWIYPKDHGQGLEPVSPEKWASTAELKGRLTSKDPAVRAHAIEALVARDRNGAAAAVLKALHDSDEQVRTQALYAANSQGTSLPLETLLTLARTDPSATVRFLALSGLEGHPEASSAARDALQDPSPFVRNKATEMLSALEPAPQSPQTFRNQVPAQSQEDNAR